jgi:ATP-dependent Clp protease ATP-binding subunit ClpB
VDIQVHRLAKRLEEKHITVELSNGARELLADRGYDPVYGARPLKRVIQRLVLDPLAMKVLEGTVSEGSHVMVGVANGELTFEASAGDSAAAAVA